MAELSDIHMLRKALELEHKARSRYLKHMQAIQDPRVNALLEGLGRNESEHAMEIERHIHRLETIAKVKG